MIKAEYGGLVHFLRTRKRDIKPGLGDFADFLKDYKSESPPGTMMFWEGEPYLLEDGEWWAADIDEDGNWTKGEGQKLADVKTMRDFIAELEE